MIELVSSWKKISFKFGQFKTMKFFILLMMMKQGKPRKNLNTDQINVCIQLSPKSGGKLNGKVLYYDI